MGDPISILNYSLEHNCLFHNQMINNDHALKQKISKLRKIMKQPRDNIEIMTFLDIKMGTRPQLKGPMAAKVAQSLRR